MRKVVADIRNSLKTVVEVSVAAALHVDTAAYKHPDVADVADAAVAAGEDDDAVNEVAAISNLLVVVAEVLYAAVEAAEGSPDPIKSQGHFQISVLLSLCGYRAQQEQGL